MHYPGGKAKSFHHVVNLIPPHSVYIEPFLGVGSVMRAKRRAKFEFGIDLDERALERSELSEIGIKLIHGDGMSFLERFHFKGHEVVYCDPPYHPDSRRRDRVYRFDMDKEGHIRFLELITKIKARIIVSGYDNKMYRQYLYDWHSYTYSAKAHVGVRDECLWFNYSQPTQLHDYRYLGSNFRERQTIKRRLDRIQRRLIRLTAQERSFLMMWLKSMEISDAG